MKKTNFKGLKNKEKLKQSDIQVQFNMDDDIYAACALHDKLHMSIVHCSLVSSRVLFRVAKRFSYQAKDPGWRGATTLTERNLYRALAKHLRAKARS